MYPISSSLRVMIWIVTGIGSLTFAMLAIVLEKNIAFKVRKRGRPPSQKPRYLWLVFWMSAVIMILGTAIASSAPDVTAIKNNISTSLPTIYQTSTPSSFLVSAPTLNAQQVNISEFIDFPFSLENGELWYANLDGKGTDEIIVIGADQSDYWSPAFVILLAYFDDTRTWQSVLHLVDNKLCGFHAGILDLKKDSTRQLLIYQQCGSGSFISFDIYQFRGLKFAELLYRLSEPSGHSIVEIAGGELYLTSYLDYDLYHYYWSGSTVEVESIPAASLPSNLEEVYYYREGDSVLFSDNVLVINAGDFVRFIHDDIDDTEPCYGVASVDDKFFEYTEYPNVILSKASGMTTIYLYCQMQPAGGVLKVVIR